MKSLATNETGIPLMDFSNLTKRRKVITRNTGSGFSIQGYSLREWLEVLNSSSGIYFLDIDPATENQYSLHFKDHKSSSLMELEYHPEPKETEDKRKDFLEALIFDLALFQDEQILVFNRRAVQAYLKNLSAIYYEHSDALNSIIGRLIGMDMHEIFKSGIYNDPRIQELTVDGVYHGLYPGTSRIFSKAQGSYGMYLIILAVQSVFYQITGKKIAA